MGFGLALGWMDGWNRRMQQHTPREQPHCDGMVYLEDTSVLVDDAIKSGGILKERIVVCIGPVFAQGQIGENVRERVVGWRRGMLRCESNKQEEAMTKVYEGGGGLKAVGRGAPTRYKESRRRWISTEGSMTHASTRSALLAGTIGEDSARTGPLVAPATVL